jgi:hypothetical protein
MPDPIARSENPAIRHFYEDNPTGPTVEEVKARQSPSNAVEEIVSVVVDEIARDGAKHATVHLAKGAAELLGSTRIVGFIEKYNPYLVAFTGTLDAFELAVLKPAERGEALAHAAASDSARFVATAIVNLTDPKLLPNGYVVSERVRMKNPGQNSPSMIMAARIQTDIAKGDSEAIAFRDALVTSTRAGLDAVYQLHIDSKEALDKVFAGDAELRARFETDPGFQIGVRAGLWQAQTYPEKFAQAESLRGEFSALISLSRSA